jgi:trigger factor
MTETASPTTESPYQIRVEDVGPGTKKVYVQIPRSAIDTKMTEQLNELRTHAHLPGFRPGHAPAALIQKKFGDELKDQVRRQLIGESYEQALSSNSLKVIGEPEFDDIKAISTLPASGDMTYAITVEIQPTINLPSLVGVEVKKPKIEVTEANVDQAMKNLREQQGTLVPVETEASANDFLVGDFHLKLDGNVIGHQHGAQLLVKDGSVAGIAIPDLESKLVGFKPGETRTLEADVPADFPQAQIAGKHVQVEIKVNDIKRLEPAVIDQDFLDSLGFINEEELREALREQLIERIEYDVAEAMRNQVRKYLLDNTVVELPVKMTSRQADRVVQRRAMDLMMRGVPREQLEANVARLREGSTEEAQRELKLFFVISHIANEREIEVDEEELNGRIATIAALRGERPEKLKQTMAKDGSLQNLYLQIREQKALDTVIAEGKIEEVEIKAEDASKQAEVGAATATPESSSGTEAPATQDHPST